MKVFKTIVWTSLFWIVALGGVWVASFWEPMVVKAVIAALPEPVWMQIYNDGLKSGFKNGKADCSCPEVNCPQDIISENEMIDPAQQGDPAPEVMIETEETPSQASLLTPAPQTELEQLQTRLTELENNHWALVKELQTIFSSPAAQSLLPAPIPVAEAPAAQ